MAPILAERLAVKPPNMEPVFSAPAFTPSAVFWYLHTLKKKSKIKITIKRLEGQEQEEKANQADPDHNPANNQAQLIITGSSVAAPSNIPIDWLRRQVGSVRQLALGYRPNPQSNWNIRSSNLFYIYLLNIYIYNIKLGLMVVNHK